MKWHERIGNWHERLSDFYYDQREYWWDSGNTRRIQICSLGLIVLSILLANSELGEIFEILASPLEQSHMSISAANLQLLFAWAGPLGLAFAAMIIFFKHLKVMFDSSIKRYVMGAIIAGLNFVAYAVAMAISISIVSGAIGLPAQELITTVRLVAIMVYIAPLMFIVMAISVLIFFVQYTMFLLSLAKEKIVVLFRQVPLMIGTVVIALSAGVVFNFTVNNIELLERPVGYLAAIVDFQEAANMPNTEEGERIFLHSSGVVYYVRIQNGELIFSTR